MGTAVGFDALPLRASLDAVLGALGEICNRSYSRVGTLANPSLNGGLPCVLLKHAALKALYVETGRAVSQGPRMVYRERPPDDDCGNVMF